MIAEELYEAGKVAKDAGDYAKALEYCQLVGDLGYSDAIKEIGNLYYKGFGMEPGALQVWAFFCAALQKCREIGTFFCHQPPGCWLHTIDCENLGLCKTGRNAADTVHLL